MRAYSFMHIVFIDSGPTSSECLFSCHHRRLHNFFSKLGIIFYKHIFVISHTENWGVILKFHEKYGQ